MRWATHYGMAQNPSLHNAYIMLFLLHHYAYHSSSYSIVLKNNLFPHTNNDECIIN